MDNIIMTADDARRENLRLLQYPVDVSVAPTNPTASGACVCQNIEHEILRSVATTVTANLWHDNSNLVDLVHDTTPSAADKCSYILHRRAAMTSTWAGPVAELVERLATPLRASLLVTMEELLKELSTGDKIDFLSMKPVFFIEAQPASYRVDMRFECYRKKRSVHGVGLSEITEEDPMIQTVKSQLQYGECDLFLKDSLYMARLRMFVFFHPVSSTAEIQARLLVEKFAPGERMITLNGSFRVKKGYIMWYGLFRPAPT